MASSTVFDQQLARVQAGERIPADVIRELAQSPDILALGMLADALRRHLHGTRATYLRVATCPFDGSFADRSPVSAREIRITGHPPSLDVAVAAVVASGVLAAAHAALVGRATREEHSAAQAPKPRSQARPLDFCVRTHAPFRPENRR